MFTDPKHCEHALEYRQAVATSAIESGSGYIPLQEPRLYVVCLDCGKAEEARL